MKKILVIFFAILMLFGSTACNDESADRGSYVTLASFDSYQEVRQFNWSSRFGKAEINEDKAFIREGSGSLCVMPYGDFENGIVPTITIRTASEYFAKSDLSKAEYLVMDVFNPQEETLTLRMWLVTEDESKNQSNTPQISVSLKPSDWTKVMYSLEDGSIRRAFEMQSISAVKLQFPEYRESFGEYVPNKLYLDNLICCEKEELKVYEPERASDEISFFETLGDVNLWKATDGLFTFTEGRTPFVTQGQYSMRTEGKGSLTLYSDQWSGLSMENIRGVSLDIVNISTTGGRFTLTLGQTGEQVKEWSIGEFILSGETKKLELMLPEEVAFADIDYLTIGINTDSACIDHIAAIN